MSDDDPPTIFDWAIAAVAVGLAIYGGMCLSSPWP